jgi:hypothetical protein
LFVAVPFLQNDAAVLLDVTLSHNGVVRQWTITSTPYGWSCKVVSPQQVTVHGCSTLERAVAKLQQCDAEIAAARAEGWS